MVTNMAKMSTTLSTMGFNPSLTKSDRDHAKEVGDIDIKFQLLLSRTEFVTDAITGILPELSVPFLRFLRETKLTRAAMGFQESFASHLVKLHKSENRLDAGFEVSPTQFDSLLLSLFKNAQFQQTVPLPIDPQGIHDKISLVHFC
jgi:hypothetical protein